MEQHPKGDVVVHRTQWPRAMIIAMGVIAAAVPAAGCPGSLEKSSAKPSHEAATLASFSFDDLNGDSLSWNEGRLRTGGAERTPSALFVHVFQPDCGKCAALACSLQAVVATSPSDAAVGIAHRLGNSQSRVFVGRTGITYPVAVGTGSAWAKRWGRGDPLYIVDGRGRIAYRQTGFREDDVPRWRAVIEDLRAGRPARFTTAERASLEAGDPLPRIELADLMTGRSLSLTTEAGRLRFVDALGRVHRYRASVGFFSRY